MFLRSFLKSSGNDQNVIRNHLWGLKRPYLIINAIFEVFRTQFQKAYFETFFSWRFAWKVEEVRGFQEDFGIENPKIQKNYSFWAHLYPCVHMRSLQAFRNVKWMYWRLQIRHRCKLCTLFWFFLDHCQQPLLSVKPVRASYGPSREEILEKAKKLKFFIFWVYLYPCVHMRSLQAFTNVKWMHWRLQIRHRSKLRTLFWFFWITFSNHCWGWNQ